MAPSRIRNIMDKKSRVLILQEIMKGKSILFDESRNKNEIDDEWKKIANFARTKLGMINRDYKYFKGPFMFGCKTSLAVS